MFGYGNFERAIAALDELFSLQAIIVCGDRFTAADVYVGSQIMFPMQFGLLPERDSFVRYRDRLRPAPPTSAPTRSTRSSSPRSQAAPSRNRPEREFSDEVRPIEAQQLGPGAFGRGWS